MNMIMNCDSTDSEMSLGENGVPKIVLLSKVKNLLRSNAKILSLTLLVVIIFGLIFGLMGRISKLETIVSEQQNQHSFHSKAGSAIDCREMRNHGMNQSGYFLVDPDGRYNGMSSFEVYCDFVKNQTIVSPNSNPIRIEDTNYLTNFEYPVSYEAPIDKIRQLIISSRLCSQKISIECQNMPLQSKGVDRAWWLDYQGKKVYFFDGNNPKVRKCSRSYCICNHPNTKFQEIGRITADWLLPVTGFGYIPDHGDNHESIKELKVNVGDVVCEESMNLDIEGQLEDAIGKQEVKKILNEQTDKLDIQFDIEIFKIVDDESTGWNSCKKILLIEANEDSFEVPGVRYCLNSRNLTVSFNSDGEYYYYARHEMKPLNEKHHVKITKVREDNARYLSFICTVQVDNETIFSKNTNFFRRPSIEKEDKILTFKSVEEYGIRISNLKIVE